MENVTEGSLLFRRGARVAAGVGLIVFIGLVTLKAIPALLLLFTAFLLSLLLSGLATTVARWTRLRYGLALTLSGVAVLAALAGAAWFVGSGLGEQVAGVGEALPEGLRRAEELVRQGARNAGVGDDEIPPVSDALPATEDLASGAMGVLGGVAGALSSAIFIVLLGVFFSSSPETYRHGLLYLVSKSRRQRTEEVMDAVAGAVRKWLVARLIIMAVTFCTTWGGLSLIGVPFAGGLAVLSALVTFVPYVGPYISGSVAVLVALLDGPEKALYTAGLYLALENVQGWTVEPLVEARLTKAPPGLLLSAQVVLGLLLGATGFVLASPLVVALTVLVQTLYVQDVLGYNDLRVLGEPEPGS
jgi:predicted PurR-regulated permease PerM